MPSNQGINPDDEVANSEDVVTPPQPAYVPPAQQQLQLDPAMMQPPAPQPPIPPPTSLNNQQFVEGELGRGEEQRRLNDEKAALEIKAKQDEAAAAQKAIDDQNKQQADEKARHEQSMADSLKRQEEIKAKVQENFASEVDPERFWNNKSTAGKVTSVIGILLSGIGMGIAHRPGENPAMDQLNRSINQDIDAQKHHIDNNWKGIQALHQLDNDATTRETHDEVWRNNFRTAALEQTRQEMNKRAALSASDVIKNNAASANLLIDKEQADLAHRNYLLGVQTAAAGSERLRKLNDQADADVQKLIEKDGVTYQDAMQSVYSRPKYAPLLTPAMRDQIGTPTGAIVPKAGKEATDKDARERTVTIGGQNYIGNSAKQAEEAKTAIDSANEIIRINKRIHELQTNGKVLMPADMAELKTLMDQGALHYPRMQTGSARINENELKKGEEVYGQPGLVNTDWFGKSAARLDAITAQAQQHIKDAQDGLKPLNTPAPGATPPSAPSAKNVARTNAALGFKPTVPASTSAPAPTAPPQLGSVPSWQQNDNARYAEEQAKKALEKNAKELEDRKRAEKAYLAAHPGAKSNL